ncbi:MAG: hypothetical protein N3A69_00430 [Leptospiraceae bacterium]|nr:hypothetical protein [Leptospiraceae bacterium]
MNEDKFIQGVETLDENKEYFVHFGHHFETEEEYYTSVVQRGEVRNAVSLAAARFWFKKYSELKKEKENEKHS